MQQRWVISLPTVLIVDRDASNAAALGLLLEPEFAIVIASSGAQAIDLISHAAPDLILLDVIMPDMDGYSLCAKLKADLSTAAIPIIFITGLQEEELESYGLEIGAADYVTRPFNANVVRARVRNNVELKRARDRLLALADTDGLTGLANRRAFDESLIHEWKRLARSRKQMSLIMLDIDFFKAFNDTYGHIAGDACLRTIAAVLVAHTQRPTDLAARYGGEEFVCLLPETSLDAAVDLAERIRAAVVASAIPHAGSAIAAYVTASFGVATEPCTSTATGSHLLSTADDRLYQAKHSGRNQVNATSPLSSRA